MNGGLIQSVGLCECMYVGIHMPVCKCVRMCNMYVHV
jgi:hypothetical protein